MQADPGRRAVERLAHLRAVPIAHAVDALLDEVAPPEAIGETAERVEGPIRSVGTGVAVLDRLFGGGLRRDEVMVVEADNRAQARALLSTIARMAMARRLLDGPDFSETTALLMAGAAAIPVVGVRTATMSQREWDAAVAALPHLCDQELLVSSSGTLPALARTANAADVDLLVVADADRFGAPIEVIPSLSRMASSGGFAVIATLDRLGDLPGWAMEAVSAVSMLSYELAGRAVLTRADRDDLLAVARLRVECLSGTVRADAE